MSTTRTASSTRIHRTLALAGTAMLFGGAALAAAAPAQAAGAVLDPVQVERSCKTPGKSGSPEKAYYSSVVLRGSATGSSTFTFDSLTVQKNPALTQITPKQVTVPAGSTTTVTIQVTGAKNSANGPAVLRSTVNQGGTTSQHTGTITNFAPMQTADCGVTYPSNVNKPWPITGGKVVSVDGNGTPQYVPTSAQTGVTQVFASETGQYAFKSDGTTLAWNADGPVSLPSSYTNLKSIDRSWASSSAIDYELAVTADGTVVGRNLSEGMPDPAVLWEMVGRTGIKSVSAGGSWAFAVTTAGTVTGSGSEDSGGYGHAWVPEGLDHVSTVAAGNQRAMALKTDGTVVAWNDYGLVPVPAEVHDVVEIGAGYRNGLVALRTDGTVVYWTEGGPATIIATDAIHTALVNDNQVFVEHQGGDVTVTDTGTDTITPVPSMKGATQLHGRGPEAVALIPGS